jgi:hypothetical protein
MMFVISIFEITSTCICVNGKNRLWAQVTEAQRAEVRAQRLLGGERFGFSRCEAAGADETEQKHLLRIFAAATLKKEFIENFCEVEDAECFGGFALVQTHRNTKSRIELLITTKRAA